MAGTVLPLFHARDFDFSDVDASSTETFVLVKALEVTEYRQAVLLVRVHSITVTGSPTFAIRAYVTAPTAFAPSADFVHTGFWLANVSVVGASAGDLLRASLGARFGAHVRVVVTATQPDPSETIRARLSAGLLVRR